MMKRSIKNLIVFLLIINSLNGYSQTINGVVQNESKNNIAGAIIGIEGESSGDITDKDGSFSIDLTNVDKNRNVIVYLGGYEPYRAKVSDFINQNTHNIILKDKIINIEPVVITSNNLREKNIGINSKSKRSYCGFNSKSNKQLLKEYAIRFKNDKKLKIKNIHINVSEYKITKPIVLIFDIYSSKDSMPDKSLSGKVISKEIKDNSEIKNNIISMDISNENIWFEDDFFVSVRVANDFEGYLYLSGNILAMSQKTYYRYYYGTWESYTSGAPSINLDVLIRK
jgi:hypothetical protein